jgi:hypothetical protein
MIMMKHGMAKPAVVKSSVKNNLIGQSERHNPLSITNRPAKVQPIDSKKPQNAKKTAKKTGSFLAPKIPKAPKSPVAKIK